RAWPAGGWRSGQSAASAGRRAGCPHLCAAARRPPWRAGGDRPHRPRLFLAPAVRAHGVCRRSYVTLAFLELTEYVFDGEIAALEPRQQLARRRPLRLAGRFDLHERQQRADAVQAILDGGVADTEELLHLLDGAVAADEGGDEGLVFSRQACERGDFEAALDRDVLIRQADAL